MKKISRSFIILLNFILIITLTTPIQALSPKYVEDTLILDLSKQDENGNILIYFDEINNIKVGLTISKIITGLQEDNSLMQTNGYYVSDPGQWSSGTLPEGTFTLRPWIQGLDSFEEVSFLVDVNYTGTVVEMANLRNPIVYLSSIYEVSSIFKSIVRAKSTQSASALSKMTYKVSLAANPFDSWKDCYLQVEVNYLGQTKVSWKYYVESF